MGEKPLFQHYYNDIRLYETYALRRVFNSASVSIAFLIYGKFHEGFVSRPTLLMALLCGSASVVSGGALAFANESGANPILRHLREERLLPFERTPEELKRPPIHYKGFVITPKLAASGVYNGNIYMSDRYKKGDFVTETSPELTIAKYYNDHSYGLHLKAKDRRHARYHGEDTTDFSAEAKARLRVSESLRLPFSVFYGRETLTRGAANRTLLKELTHYDRLRGEGGLDYRFNRLNVKLIGHYEIRDFENGREMGSGDVVRLDAKNRDEYGATLLGIYDLTQDHAVYAGVARTRQQFDRFADGMGNDTSGLRSNDGLRYMAGIKTRYKDLLIGDIGIHYTVQDFDSKQAGRVDKTGAAADLSYMVTPKLSVRMSAGHEITQDNDSARGVVKSRYGAGLDYEFQHNLYGRAEAFYEDHDFVDSSLHENILGGGVSLRYLHSDRFESQIGAFYQSRESDIRDRDHDQWIFRYGITARF